MLLSRSTSGEMLFPHLVLRVIVMLPQGARSDQLFQRLRLWGQLSHRCHTKHGKTKTQSRQQSETQQWQTENEKGSELAFDLCQKCRFSPLGFGGMVNGEHPMPPNLGCD